MYLVVIDNHGQETIINDVSVSNTAPRAEGTVKQGINCINSLTITVYANNPGFDLIEPYVTKIKVYNTKTGEYEFIGRPITPGQVMDSDGTCYRTFVCEGELGYLCDTYQDYAEPENISPGNYLTKLIQYHNDRIGDEDKAFIVGTVSVTDSNDSVYRGIAYDTTWKNISDDLVDSLGGEIWLRYGDSGERIIDYLEDYGEISDTVIKIGWNMESVDESKDFSEFATRIIPLGAPLTDADDNETNVRLDITSVNNGLNYVQDDDLVNTYGIIEMIVTWDDVTTANALLSKAKTYMENMRLTESNEISAYDLSLVGLDFDSFKVGNYYRVVNTILGIDKYLRIIEKTIDISSPEASTLTFGDKATDIISVQVQESRKQSESLKDLSEEVYGKFKEITSVEYLKAKIGEFGYLTAEEAALEYATIADLEANYLKATVADVKYATIEQADILEANISIVTGDLANYKTVIAEQLSAYDAEIETLDTEKLSATEASIKYANVDFSNIGMVAIEQFFSKSGMISDLVVGDSTVSGKLVGVTIVGDLIEGGTIKADKLVVLGEDGLYYKLNVSGETVEAEQTQYNSLDGSHILAQSITASKITVEDLVAFGATIGGFHITDSSIYSGVKESATNTTRGVFLGNDGQIAFGDDTNYVRYLKDTESNTWKLEINAQTIKMGGTGKTIEEELTDIREDVTAELNEICDEVTCTLYIGSSNGTCFKNDNISTVLSVTIYRGSKRITDITALQESLGSTASLQWSFKRIGDDTVYIIDPSDIRISDSGFRFTINADDVDASSTFFCDLII